MNTSNFVTINVPPGRKLNNKMLSKVYATGAELVGKGGAIGQLKVYRIYLQWGNN